MQPKTRFILASLLVLSLLSLVVANVVTQPKTGTATTIAPSAPGITIGNLQGMSIGNGDTVLMTVTNTGSTAITITNVLVNGQSSYVYYGNGRYYLKAGHYEVTPGICAGTCSIALVPGQSLPIQAQPPGYAICSAVGTWGGVSGISYNAVRTSAPVQVTITYQAGGLPASASVQTASVAQKIPCYDYWLCKTNTQCTAKYGCDEGGWGCLCDTQSRGCGIGAP
ncbi:MAG: hypothetical protein NTV88_06235 [Candidatus Micrarchaeota archaeon]|nr:hypothetical protein [Candidatus Micrarchaeota archaeon]